MKAISVQQSEQLNGIVHDAAKCVNTLYPLTNFVAVNALKNYESIPFEQAMGRSSELFGTHGFLKLADYRAMYESGRIGASDLEEAFNRYRHEAHSEPPQPSLYCLAELLDSASNAQAVSIINRELIKWCAAYLDGVQAQWSPLQKESLYLFWKELACHDHSMWWQGCLDWSGSVRALPREAGETLTLALRELDLQEDEIKAYLERHIACLPGFASHLKWQEEENAKTGILTDYLAIRLFYETKIANVLAGREHDRKPIGRLRKELSRRSDPITKPVGSGYAIVWQEAYELNYRNRLLEKIKNEPARGEKASCQLVFCIDVRSEPIRKELEKLAPYATFGFAGFFAMPMRFRQLGSAMSFDLCPVLIKPDKEVHERGHKDAASLASWQTLAASALQLKKKLKCNLAGAFGLVELLGVWSAIPLFGKTFAPRWYKNTASFLRSKVRAENPATSLDASAFSLDEKTALAEGALRGIGFSHFAPVIVLCGHKSSSINNPYASSLDCGACGGNGGGYNARLAADILNDKDVRMQLSARQINISDETVFIAAEHDTTTDLFNLFKVENLSPEQESIVKNLKDDLIAAGRAVRSRRTPNLPANALSYLDDPLARACDWAQVAPELGLAGNASFIAAPRSLTKHSDLEGRSFLHSYQCEQDKDGSILELIMTAPLVVAQWINMQYYLSTVDQEVFGSGSKVLHNVVGDFGVMQGKMSDLKIGLPLQSIMTSGRTQHEPMRLLAVIRAPLEEIDKVLSKHAHIRQLVCNRWIRLVGLDPTTAEFFQAEDAGVWRRVKISAPAIATQHRADSDRSRDPARSHA